MNNSNLRIDNLEPTPKAFHGQINSNSVYKNGMSKVNHINSMNNAADKELQDISPFSNDREKFLVSNFTPSNFKDLSGKVKNILNASDPTTSGKDIKVAENRLNTTVEGKQSFCASKLTEKECFHA